jgi:hypothetical protein
LDPGKGTRIEGGRSEELIGGEVHGGGHLGVSPKTCKPLHTYGENFA